MINKRTNGGILLNNIFSIIGGLLIVAATILLFPLGIILWLRSEPLEYEVWQRWYAWRPVKLHKTETYTWFKWVERYETCYHGFDHSYTITTYREQQKENNNG